MAYNKSSSLVVQNNFLESVSVMIELMRHLYLKSTTIVRFIVQGAWYYLMIALTPRRVKNINLFERRIYSQNGEDGIIMYIFRRIGILNKYFVEIGVEDGLQCNTRYLKRWGWRGIQVDSRTTPGVKSHFVTAENIESIFTKYKVPKKFDLLSIDIDGNDYWVWKAIEHYQPRVVIIEYNASIPSGKKLTIPYDPKFSWDGTTFFGASLEALVSLGNRKGYELVATNKAGMNAFFVRKGLARKHFIRRSIKDLYHSPKYNLKVRGKYIGHEKSKKMSKLVEV